MKELQEIFQSIVRFKENKRAILATVVDVVGSGYRRVGARMLIDETGFSVGTVSGGCLETDVLERAKKVLKTSEPIVITYDTTQDENSVFGLNMGCRGIIRVLLEPFGIETTLAQTFQKTLENRHRQFIATLISPVNDLIGERFFFNEQQLFDFQNLSELFATNKDFRGDCENFFTENNKAEVRKYTIANETFEFLFENINPPLSLLLFGAGFDTLPVINIAKELGWLVTVIDHRSAFANTERLPKADEIIVSAAEDLPEEILRDENSVAVVMTHNYNRDREILFRLLNSKCQYIGALGPKSRTERLIDELRSADKVFNEANLKKLFAPIGLDIGSETPEEIALAITAEIKTVLANRKPGFLRDKIGSINVA